MEKYGDLLAELSDDSDFENQTNLKPNRPGLFSSNSLADSLENKSTRSKKKSKDPKKKFTSIFLNFAQNHIRQLEKMGEEIETEKRG
jgi:hypothetical protein